MYRTVKEHLRMTFAYGWVALGWEAALLILPKSRTDNPDPSDDSVSIYYSSVFVCLH